MNNLLAKAKVAEVTDYGNNNKRTRLSAVTGDTDENKTFSLYTPQLEVNILVNNPDNIDFFEAGQEIYLTFSKDKPLRNDVLNLLKNAYVVLSDVKTFAEKCPDGGNLQKVIGWALTEAGIKTFKFDNIVVDMDWIQNQIRGNNDNYSDLYNTADIGDTFTIHPNGRIVQVTRLT